MMITVSEVFRKHENENVTIDFFWKYTCRECGKKWLEHDEEVSFCGDKDDYWDYRKDYDGWIEFDDVLKYDKNKNRYMDIREVIEDDICTECREGYMTLKEVLEMYKEEQPDLKLNVNYLDENKTLLFTLKEETATNILADKDKVNYLDSKVFDYKDNVINVYYDNPAIIL